MYICLKVIVAIMFIASACPIIGADKYLFVASYQLCSCPSSGPNCTTNNQDVQTFSTTFVRLHLITQIKIVMSASLEITSNLPLFVLFSFTNNSNVWENLQVSQYLVSSFIC